MCAVPILRVTGISSIHTHTSQGSRSHAFIKSSKRPKQKCAEYFLYNGGHYEIYQTSVALSNLILAFIGVVRLHLGFDDLHKGGPATPPAPHPPPPSPTIITITMNTVEGIFCDYSRAGSCNFVFVFHRVCEALCVYIALYVYIAFSKQKMPNSKHPQTEYWYFPDSK